MVHATGRTGNALYQKAIRFHFQPVRYDQQSNWHGGYGHVEASDGKLSLFRVLETLKHVETFSSSHFVGKFPNIPSHIQNQTTIGDVLCKGPQVYILAQSRTLQLGFDTSLSTQCHVGLRLSVSL